MRRALLSMMLVLLPGLLWAQTQAQVGPPFLSYVPPPAAAWTGGAFTAPLLAPAANNCAAVPYSFTGDSNTGICSSAADGVGLIAGGTSTFTLSPNLIELKNGVTPQSFNVYNTYTDASNYQRTSLYSDGSYAYLRTQGLGTGTAQGLVIGNGTSLIWLYGQPLPFASDSVPLGSTSSFWTTLYTSRSLQGSKSKAVADNTATAFVRLSVSDDDYEGCAFGWTAYAEDADTDARQVTKGRNNVAILNTSGTETCVVSASADDVATNVTAGSLACSFDCNSASAATIDLRATCNTSLDAAAETLTFEYRLDCESTTTVTPQ